MASESIWNESDWIPISALQHYSYCPRQCALIHMEQVFAENAHTIRGRTVHERVDQPASNYEADVRVERALPLRSVRLGLAGKADVVEFGRDGTPFPVEYKHGRRREREHDDLQLGAQAICLEEMMGVPVPLGAIYHHSSRHRREVEIGDKLREAIEKVTLQVREMLASKTLPPPTDDIRRCPECSLRDICQPDIARASKKLSDLHSQLFEPDSEPS